MNIAAKQRPVPSLSILPCLGAISAGCRQPGGNNRFLLETEFVRSFPQPAHYLSTKNQPS